jgi:uncharacterized protein YlzI (FlbEa/FlbD family)
MMGVIEKITSASEDDVRKVREKIEQYLEKMGITAIDPENLKSDINSIVSDPKGTKSVVLNRLKQFDHPTLVTIVTEKAHVPREKADQVVNRIESAFQSIKDKVAQAKTDGNGRNLKNTTEERIKNYLNSLQRPEFDYEAIKNDFEQMLHDPKVSFEIIKNRLQQFDRESLIALISSRPNVSREDAEKIVIRIEEARDNVLVKAAEIEEAVKEKSQEMKQMAVHQAESLRQSVAAAAWWLFATALFSAGAAAWGGALAL